MQQTNLRGSQNFNLPEMLVSNTLTIFNLKILIWSFSLIIIQRKYHSSKRANKNMFKIVGKPVTQLLKSKFRKYKNW